MFSPVSGAAPGERDVREGASCVPDLAASDAAHLTRKRPCIKIHESFYREENGLNRRLSLVQALLRPLGVI